MELSEKIAMLRKARGLTQEQLAEKLFVSRTAVSKWETGRGMPGMDSLQQMAKFFGITLDELLSTEEIISIAERENRENLRRFVSRTDGILDLAAVTGMVLPLYKTENMGQFYSVPLWRYEGWLSVLYWVFPAAMLLCGILQLCLVEKEKRRNALRMTGMLLCICTVFLLLLSGQPYPGTLFFVLLLLKGAVLLGKIPGVSQM